MATHRYDPYLWVHLAGIATVPLWLAICALGLAVGSPQWPGLELALLAGLGVSPALLMQLGRPFYIFSLLALTLKSTALSDDQRRLLTLFQQWWIKGLAVAAPVPLVWLLWEIYPRAVVASDITPFTPWGRLGGLAVAAGSFAMANLFLQVPVSVLAVMATSEKRFKRTSPYPLDQIQDRFTQIGIPLSRLLPEVLPPEGETSTVQEVVERDAPLRQSDAVSAAPANVAATPSVGTDIHPATLDQAGEPGSESVGSDLVDSETTEFELAGSQAASLLNLEATAPEAERDDAQVGAEALPETLGLEPAVSGVAEPSLAFLEIKADMQHLAELREAAETPEDTAEDRAEEIVEAVEAVDAAGATPAFDAHGANGWDQGSSDWDQANQAWDQETTWETPGEPAKDKTIEVAVVRISDPS